MVRWTDWVSFDADWLGEGPDCFESLCQPYPPRIVSPSDPSELNPTHFANRVCCNELPVVRIVLSLCRIKPANGKGRQCGIRTKYHGHCIELRNEPGAMMIGHELYLRVST
jgi:hypothetical protein